MFRREDLIEIPECFAGVDPETPGVQSVAAAAPVPEKREILEVNEIKNLQFIYLLYFVFVLYFYFSFNLTFNHAQFQKFPLM